MTFLHSFFFLLALNLYLPAFLAGQLSLLSTESDPDAFIQSSVNVINGYYCESAIDLLVTGPDALVLQRFYSSKNAVTGTQTGGWRILPERFLVIGKDVSKKSCTIGKDQFVWSSAFIGERSGGILPYSGWRNTNGTTKDPLKVNIFNNAVGLVNTYSKEINGQTNHQNNSLNCNGTTCELLLGDGTKRIYQKAERLPSLLLGEELTPLMANQVIEPDFYLLSQEILPSGNQVFFSYDTEGHLISIEMKNKSLTKVFSWIKFKYEIEETGCVVNVETSDSRELTYSFSLENGNYQLVRLEGSHCRPIIYEYNDALTRKNLLENRFVEIDYQDGKVKSLKSPNAQTGNAEITHSFAYGESHTDVFNAKGTKTRYIYDKRFQLVSVEKYDSRNCLYHIEQKFWGKTKQDAGLLLAKTIGDGSGRILSYRSFQYDKAGNVSEERLYGNLTGKKEASLQISQEGKLLNADEEECNIKTFTYSDDGFNLLIKMGDCKGNQTVYTYKPNSNLLIKKLIFDNSYIKKRTFQFYDENAVCIKMVEDDGTHEDGSQRYDWCITERHIKEIKPKETLPGVGLPEIIAEKSFDRIKSQEILIKKLVNVYDDQSNLLSCATYDANDAYAYTETRTYSLYGEVLSQIDAIGRQNNFSYDAVGNQITVSNLQESKSIATAVDFQNQPIEITETNAEGQFTITNTYDILGRKTCSTDRYGNSTYYEYDDFHRLVKVIHPRVLDENNQIIQPTFNYTYDLFGNVLTIKDPEGNVTQKCYNLRGDPTKINYPDGSFELFKYDTEGSLHRSMTRDRIITVYEYDYLGRCIHEEVSTIGLSDDTPSYLMHRLRNYNAFRCTWEKENNHVKNYIYDLTGKLTSIAGYVSGQNEKSPESHLTEILYDSLGRPNRKKIWFGNESQDYTLECFDHDLAGNVIEKRIEDAQGTTFLKKCFSYDLQGRCTEEYTFEKGVKTSLLRTSYNAEGQPTSYLDGSAQETKIIIDNTHQNSLGQKVLKKTIINPIAVQTEMEFDALMRIHSIIKRDPFGFLLSSQKILYDSLGNKACEVHDRIVDGEIIDSQKTRWIYGPMGRLEEEIEAADTSLETRTSYSYNSLGQLTGKSTSGITTPITYTYNRQGKVSKIEGENTKKEFQILNNYNYDPKGNIESASSIQGLSIQRDYDTFNQVTKEIVNDGIGKYTLLYKYDRKGRLKEITLPDNSKILYTYDAVFGREVKRISTKGEVLYTHTYDQYDNQGRLQKESCIDYTGPKEYTYNLNGQKISSKNEYFHEEYTRDPLGRLTEVNSDKHEEYTYNFLSQLISERKSDTKMYHYDSLDNRIKVDNKERLYNALNQLESYSNAEFKYDPSGNLQRKVLDGEQSGFESNILAQLISIEKNDKTSLAFSYDPFGRMLVERHLDSKEKKTKTSRCFYVGFQEIGTLTEAGKIETLKIPGLNGNELAPTSVAFEIKEETYAPLHDIAGNVIGLVDPQNHELVESYQYTAFGNETILDAYGEIKKDSIVGNPWRFAEKRTDQKSGLVLFGLRFYDPTAGRWISKDPAGLIDGPNLYAYVHNNPLNHLDRFGLSTESSSQSKFEAYFLGEVERHCFCETHRTCKRGGDIGKTVGSHLPKIVYDDSYERVFKDYYSNPLVLEDYYDNSVYYDLSSDGVPNLPNDLGIGFINGIWNDSKGSRESVDYISRLAGGYNVHAVYNATHGKMDIPECLMGLNYIATEPVRQLHKMWNSFFDKSSANAKFLMICHSQGAIHVRNALLDYPAELRERILVVTIAPGAYMYRETCGDVFHYRAEWWRDFVPRLDGSGGRRENHSITTLRSHPDAHAFDHEFMSPTYQERLQRHIRNYLSSQGKML